MDLTQLGAQAAAERKPEGRSGGRAWAREIRRALAQVGAAQARESRGQGEPSPAAEWLLDNWYLAQREGREAERTFRRAPRRLRRAGGTLYIARLAQALVQAGAGVDGPALDRFLLGIQAERPLSELELAHLVPAVKGALVCRLAELCRKLDRSDEALAGEMAAVFTGLRTLCSANLSKILEARSLVEQALRRDPAGEDRKSTRLNSSH